MIHQRILKTRQCLSMMSSDTDTTPLLQGDNEDDVSIDICGNSEAPPLPPGKLYHVFFSYAESDREFAANLINKLESELGYKCCDHQRDFIPGWKITDNIKHFVMSSLKTVVLISEESVKSAWCSYEAELTFHMSMDMRKKILIPILVDDCTIPDHLKPLTYIDARKQSNTTNWWQKLVDATSQSDEVPIFESGLPNLSSQPYTFNPNISNLEHLVKIKSKTTCISEEILTSYIPNELCCRGLKVPYSVFKEEMEMLNKLSIFKFHCCCVCRICWIPWLIIICCFFVLSTIFSVPGIYFSCTAKLTSDKTNCSIVITVLVLLILFMFGFAPSFVILAIQRKKRERELLDHISNINKRLIHYQIMMTIKSPRCSRGFDIDIVYYNYQPCLDHISSAMMSPSLASSSEEVDITMEDAAKDTLTKYSCSYLRQYLDKKLVYPSETRHTSNTLCLCQYVEEKEN